MSELNEKIRNVAIIAHVDHGKTTLVDQLMKFCQLFRENQEVEDCFLDNNDQERERGITILAKNISLNYGDIKINLIDTPGHSDFSGEVERVLKLADGCLLLVDAHDGVMPQTRFVLKKALQVGLKPIVVMNKMDRPDARPQEALDSVYNLFIDFNVSDEELDFPILYCSGRSGWASTDIGVKGENLGPLMEAIVNHIPGPKAPSGPVLMQITSFEYSDYLGRIGVGRVYRGELKLKSPLSLIKRDGSSKKVMLKKLFVFEGLGKAEVESVAAGEMCAVVGVDDVEIGDSLSDWENQEALPPIPLEEPTISMMFAANDSPGFGSDGKFVTSRHLRDALFKAAERDVAVRVEPSEEREGRFKVYGRGILHLSVLIENLRRKGYELLAGQPQVVYKEIDGVLHEPVETLVVEVKEEYAGKVIEQVAKRKGELLHIDYITDGQIQNYEIPSRGLIGLRSMLLNACSGNIVMNHRFKAFQPKAGEMQGRPYGVLVSKEEGSAVPYAIANLQDRGEFFLDPGVHVYKGQIVGAHCKDGDLEVNIQKEKKLSNMRAAGSDRSLKIAPALKMTLEDALEFIESDEWVEVTPNYIRLRKMELDPLRRKRAVA